MTDDENDFPTKKNRVPDRELPSLQPKVLRMTDFTSGAGIDKAKNEPAVGTLKAPFSAPVVPIKNLGQRRRLRWKSPAIPRVSGHWQRGRRPAR